MTCYDDNIHKSQIYIMFSEVSNVTLTSYGHANPNQAVILCGILSNYSPGKMQVLRRTKCYELD